MVQWIVSASFILVGLLAGIIGENFLLKRLKKFATKKKIPGSTILFRSLHNMVFLWLFLAGLMGAIVSAPAFNPSVLTILRNILVIVVLFSMTLVCSRLAGASIDSFLQQREGISASLFSNIAKIVVLALGGLVVLQTLGVEITPIITTLGIGGLAVSLAFKDTLENLFAGLHLILSKQVRTGDFVRLDDAHEGYVTDITWRNTAIQQLSNTVVVVPNSALASAIFTNCHLPNKEYRFQVSLGVSYNSDLDHVENVTLAVAREIMQELAPNLEQHEPFLRFENFGDHSIEFSVFIRVNAFFDHIEAKHLFIKRLHKRYHQEGIHIPFPSHELYLWDERKTNGRLPAATESKG